MTSLATLAFFVGGSSLPTQATNALNTAGTPCRAVGLTKTVKTIKYTCKKAGKSNKWTVVSPTQTPIQTPTQTNSLPIAAFVLPTQYIIGENRYDVNVSRKNAVRGETLTVTVSMTAVMRKWGSWQGETFRHPVGDDGVTLESLIKLCKSLIGVGINVPPTPVSWSPTISVSLTGTSVTAGGATDLVVIGYIIKECGDTAVTDTPSISVVRNTVYKDVVIQLTIPATLPVGTYELALAPPAGTFSKTSPIVIKIS